MSVASGGDVVEVGFVETVVVYGAAEDRVGGPGLGGQVESDVV